VDSVDNLLYQVFNRYMEEILPNFSKETPYMDAFYPRNDCGEEGEKKKFPHFRKLKGDVFISNYSRTPRIYVDKTLLCLKNEQRCHIWIIQGCSINVDKINLFPQYI
jgi:hypothetical protein